MQKEPSYVNIFDSWILYNSSFEIATMYFIFVHSKLLVDADYINVCFHKNVTCILDVLLFFCHCKWNLDEILKMGWFFEVRRMYIPKYKH